MARCPGGRRVGARAGGGEHGQSTRREQTSTNECCGAIDYPPDPSASQGLLGRGVTASSGFALPAQGERQSHTRSTCSCPCSGKTPAEKRRLVAGQPGSAKPNRATDPPSQRDQRDKNTASRPRTNS